MELPCKECIVLAICINRIEKYRENFFISSIAKKCDILSNFLYKGDHVSEKIVHTRKFFKERKSCGDSM